MQLRKKVKNDLHQSIETFIFVNVKPSWLWKVAEETAEIEGVEIARAVTGQFDVIIWLNLRKQRI